MRKKELEKLLELRTIATKKAAGPPTKLVVAEIHQAPRDPLAPTDPLANAHLAWNDGTILTIN